MTAATSSTCSADPETSDLPAVTLTAATTGAMVAPGVWMDSQTSSAVRNIRADSVLKSKVATAALTNGGSILFHLEATKMGQEQSVSCTLHLQINLISFLAVCEGVPSR